MEWIKVEDRLPENYEEVLIWDGRFRQIASQWEGYWSDMNSDTIAPTHWVSLQEPPVTNSISHPHPTVEGC